MQEAQKEVAVLKNVLILEKKKKKKKGKKRKKI